MKRVFESPWFPVCCWFIGLAGVVVLLCWPAVVRADGCSQFFSYQQSYAAKSYAYPIYYAQQYYAQPVVQYRAGLDIEAEALAEKVARRVTERLKLEQFSQQQLSTPRLTVFNAKCASCHNPGKASGGLVLDGSTLIDDYYFTRIVKMVGAGIDVPAPMQRVIGSLTPQEKGVLLDELITLHPGSSPVSSAKPDPIPAPGRPPPDRIPAPPPDPPDDGLLQ